MTPVEIVAIGVAVLFAPFVMSEIRRAVHRWCPADVVAEMKMRHVRIIKLYDQDELDPPATRTKGSQ